MTIKPAKIATVSQSYGVSMPFPSHFRLKDPPVGQSPVHLVMLMNRLTMVDQPFCNYRPSLFDQLTAFVRSQPLAGVRTVDRKSAIKA